MIEISNAVLANPSGNPQDVVCSLCRNLGVPCLVTPTEKAKALSEGGGKRKRQSTEGAGKIGDAGKQGNVDVINGVQHAGPKFVQDRHIGLGPQRPQFLQPGSKATRMDSGYQARGDAPLHSNSGPSRVPHLLDIPGLSEESLEECIDAFFRYLGVWMEIRDSPEQFMKRYRLFLALVQGRQLDTTMQDEQGNSLTPASEILVLAVASRGASYTKYSFLQEQLLARVIKLCQAGGRVTRDGLDAIEGIVLASEISIRPLYWDTQESKPCCFKLNPLGKGIAAELCLFHRLNEEPSETEPNYQNIMRVFYTIYVHDALRSASAGRMYRLSDEEVGWLDKERSQIAPMVALAYLARHLGRVLLSSRSRRRGISLLDLKTLMGALEGFPAKIDLSVDRISHGASMLEHMPESAEKAERRKKLIKGAMIMGLWLRLCLNVWMQIRERKYSPMSEEMILVEESMTEASEQVTKLAKICIDYRLIEFGPNALLSTFSAWFLYHMHKTNDARDTSRKKGNSPRSDMIATEMSSKAKTLLHAIRCSRFPVDAAKVADRLEEKLRVGSNVPMKIFSRVAERGTAILDEDGIQIEARKPGNFDGTVSDMDASTAVTSFSNQSTTQGNTPQSMMPFAIPDFQFPQFGQNNFGGSSMQDFEVPMISTDFLTKPLLDTGDTDFSFNDEDWFQIFQMCGFDMSSSKSKSLNVY